MYVSINGWLYQCGTGATSNTGVGSWVPSGSVVGVLVCVSKPELWGYLSANFLSSKPPLKCAVVILLQISKARNVFRRTKKPEFLAVASNFDGADASVLVPEFSTQDSIEVKGGAIDSSEEQED